jgi:hypothetical protein
MNFEDTAGRELYIYIYIYIVGVEIKPINEYYK